MPVFATCTWRMENMNFQRLQAFSRPEYVSNRDADCYDQFADWYRNDTEIWRMYRKAGDQ